MYAAYITSVQNLVFKEVRDKFQTNNWAKPSVLTLSALCFWEGRREKSAERGGEKVRGGRGLNSSLHTGEKRWEEGRRRRGLQVALSVEGAGEGDVVQGAGGTVGPDIPGHAADAVLGLLGRQLPAQLLHCDVVLEERHKGNNKTSVILSSIL